MNKKVLFVLWGVLFILCAGLGFMPEPQGALKILMTALSVLFFLPPAVLLYRSDRDTSLLIRNLSALSAISLSMRTPEVSFSLRYALLRRR